jgi:hypothetical protein
MRNKRACKYFRDKGLRERYEHIGEHIPPEVLQGSHTGQTGGATYEAMGARPLKGLRSGSELWLMDTGFGHDLLAQRVADKLGASLRVASEKVSLQTANGLITPRHEAPLRLEELSEDVVPLILPSTPAVLSIGRRCMEQGYGFEWPPHGIPSW